MSDYEVKVGQVWKDCDKRLRYGRYLLVDHLVGVFAYCVPCSRFGTQLSKRMTRIRMERMRPTPTGYELVWNP